MIPTEVSICRGPVRRSVDGIGARPIHDGEERTMSQYLVLLYEDEAGYANATETVWNEIMAGHQKFGENNATAVQGGNALQPSTTATTIRPDGSGSFTVTDGPFAETKEALGGYYLIEAADLDEAISIAKQVPVPFGCLEVRPIMVFS
jgi:hypothetical protein